MQGFVVRATTRIWQLAVINLTFFALTLLGGVVFGFLPALVAGLAAVAKLETHRAGELAGMMWDEFRREFLRANLTALPVVLGIALLGFAALVFGGIPGAVLLSFATLALVRLIAQLLVISKMSGSVGDAFANATLAMALAPYRLLLAAVLLIPVILIGLWQPMLAFYFGVSAWIWLAHAVVEPGLASGLPTTGTHLHVKESRL